MITDKRRMVVTIGLDNDAMGREEVVRLLREIVERIEGGSARGAVPDVNGNYDVCEYGVENRRGDHVYHKWA